MNNTLDVNLNNKEEKFYLIQYSQSEIGKVYNFPLMTLDEERVKKIYFILRQKGKVNNKVINEILDITFGSVFKEDRKISEKELKDRFSQNNKLCGIFLFALEKKCYVNIPQGFGGLYFKEGKPIRK